MEIKLRIQNEYDRDNIIIGLANAGISVRLEEETHINHMNVTNEDDYYVVFDYSVPPEAETK